MIQPWVSTRSEEEQERELRVTWAEIVRWGQREGLDRIRVDDVEPGFLSDLVDLAFQWTGQANDKWERVAAPEVLAEILLRVRDIPRIDITVFCDDLERIRVRDKSWDSVYIAVCSEEQFKPLET